MTLALVLLAVAQVPTLSANERVPLAVVVNTPTGQSARTSRSELISILDVLLKRHTDFFAQLVDETVVRDCQGNLTCVALTTRRDYKRESLMDAERRVLPYREHQRRLEENGKVVATQLLIVSNVSSPDRGDRLSLMLMDTDRALRIHHEATRRAGFADEVEIMISEQAVLASPPPHVVTDASEAQAYFGRVFDRHFTSVLAREGHWEPYGTIALDLNVAGVAVEIDGEPVGTAEAKSVRVTGIRPGDRVVTLRRVGHETTKTTARLTAGDDVSLSVSLPVESVGGGPQITSIIFWGGVAVAAAGVGLTAWGVARHDGDVKSHCFETGAGCSATNEFESLGFDPSRVGRSEDVNPSGLRVVPLGYSLVVTGATWSLGSKLFADDEYLPWISIAAGLVLGGLSYAVSVAL